MGLLPQYGIVGYLAIAAGVFEAWRYVTFERRWLAKRLASTLRGAAVELELGQGA